MTVQKSNFFELAKEAVTMPQETMVKIKSDRKSSVVGVPRETSLEENRVGLTPQAVRYLVANGFEVVVETRAGNEAKFTDEDYTQAGAKISYDKKEAFRADIIMKVTLPTIEEVELMRSGQILFSALHLQLLSTRKLKLLAEKKVTAIAFEYLKDAYNVFPVVQSMSEIAGTTAVLIAAEYLTNVNFGNGIMLGGVTGIPPSEVVILGAGTVGQLAAKTALGLGAEVKVFDNSLFKLRRLKNNLSARIFTSVLDPQNLLRALKHADVVIGAIRSPGGSAPCVVTEEMVAHMKPGAVIVDVSIDQGGCFETSEVTTHSHPTFLKYDVIHYCVPNIPSRVARTASTALANIFAPILVDIDQVGGLENYLWERNGLRHGLYYYKGKLTNAFLGERFNLSYKEIDLLLAAKW